MIVGILHVLYSDLKGTATAVYYIIAAPARHENSDVAPGSDIQSPNKVTCCYGYHGQPDLAGS